MKQHSRSFRVDFDRLVRDEQENRGALDLPDGTVGVRAEATAELLRMMHGQVDAGGELTFRHALSEAAATAVAESDDDRLMCALARVAALSGQWYESLRTRRGY